MVGNWFLCYISDGFAKDVKRCHYVKRFWNKEKSPGPCMERMFKRVPFSCLCPLRMFSAWMVKRRHNILGTVNEVDKYIFGVMEENIHKIPSRETCRGAWPKCLSLYKNQRLSLFDIISHKYFQFLPIPTPFLPLPLPFPTSGHLEWHWHYLQNQQKVNYSHILFQG